MKIIKAILWTLFTIMLSCRTQAQLQLSAADIELLRLKADTILSQAISFNEHVGLSVGIYANGEIIYEAGDGLIDMDNKLPATGDMIHRTASISKPMTAIAIMQLVEQGKIDLDVPIQTYVPDFPQKPEGTITTRQLLSHTSGINAYKGFLDGFSFKEYKTLDAAINRFKKRKLVGEPGKVFRYSTYGYVVLGKIIEQVSGMSYESYMDKYIWTPTGMQHTSVEKHKVPLANKSGMFRSKKGNLKKDLYTNLSMKAPGGGVQSTVGDLLRFGKAVIENNLVTGASMDLMTTDQKVRPKNAGNPYGFGWFLYSKDEQKPIFGHSGGQAGTSTQLMILPKQEVVVAVISNTRNANVFGINWKLIDLTTSLEDRQKPLQKAISLSETELDRFLGKYKFGEKNVLEIKRDGTQLYSNINQYKGLKLYPESANKIFYRETNAHFEFELDEQARIVKTTYVQNGKAYYPEKIE